MSAGDDLRALVRRLFDEVWNAGGSDVIPDLYAPDFIADYRPAAPLHHGHDGIRGMVQRAHATFPDYHEELIELVTEGDTVAMRLMITGTHLGPMGPIPPTGRRVEFEEMLFLRIRDGKVVWQRGIPDNRTLLEQLGILPPAPVT